MRAPLQTFVCALFGSGHWNRTFYDGVGDNVTPLATAPAGAAGKSTVNNNSNMFTSAITGSVDLQGCSSPPKEDLRVTSRAGRAKSRGTETPR